MPITPSALVKKLGVMGRAWPVVSSSSELCQLELESWARSVVPGKEGGMEEGREGGREGKRKGGREEEKKRRKKEGRREGGRKHNCVHVQLCIRLRIIATQEEK